MTKAEADRCLTAVAGGDMAALEALYTAFYRPVFLLAASLTSDAQLAQDVAQEVFVTVRTCAGQYRPGSNARAWIFGVTRNAARYCLRKARWEQPTDPLPEAPVPGGGMESHCLDGIVVNEALACLSAGEYPVVLLHVFAGIKLTEIAAALDIPYGTVLWRYAEARKKLKQYYQDHEAS